MGWIALLLLAGACAAPPPQPGPPPPTPVAAPTAPTPLLWLARPRDAGQGALYLLGSVHVGAGLPSLGRAVEAAYLRSDELVVEVDLTRVDDRQARQLLARLGSLPEGESLRNRLDEETWALLQDYMRENAMPKDSLKRFEPWVVATFMAFTELRKAGLEPDAGIDRAFLRRAKGTKPIVQLETAEGQLRMLDELPPRIQDLMIRDMLDRADHIREEADRLVAAWRRGDEQALRETLFSPLADLPELSAFYEVVFFERNERMTDKLVALCRDGKTRFVVLGAGHMLGPRGIPARLERRGFKVALVSGGTVPAAPVP